MNKTQRDKQIIASTAHPDAIAEQFGVSRSTVYRLRKEARLAAESAQAPARTEQFAARSANRKLLFQAQGNTGLQRQGDLVYEEFQRELRDDGGVKIYNRMATNAVVSAVLFAIEMAQRQVTWFVEPVSDKPKDTEAAEFLEGCLDDMSQTWDDVISQIFSMLKYGFAVAEVVYKKRLGANPSAYVKDPARSRFDDGLIGWRRWQFLSPLSLSPGRRWVFDDYGRIAGVRQTAMPDYQEKTIPIEKLLLFRTTVEWDNPEGRSVLRPMYQDWYYAENLCEIESIGAERLGTGLPVMYLGNDCSLEGPESDGTLARDIVTNVRADDQMGVVIPRPKMGSGAPEGTGMLFELVAPPSQGFVDFDKVITRHEQRMAMTALAQFIFIGMLKVGTQALNQGATDTFQMSIGAWAEMAGDVINRFAVPRLFALNAFNVEELPRINHGEVGVPDLAGLAEYVNKLVGAQVLTPDAELEDYLRDMAKLPERPEPTVEVVPSTEQAEGEEEEGEEGEASEAEAEEPEEGEPEEEASEQFAQWGAKGGGTIIGALSRNLEGEFERGAGPSAEEKAAAVLGESLLSGKVTVEQGGAFVKMGLMTRNRSSFNYTPKGKKLAETLRRTPRVGVKQLAGLMLTHGLIKKAKVGGAKGGGGKGGKGKAAKKPKAGGKKGGGGGGKGKAKEEEKLEPEAQERVDHLTKEFGLDPSLATALELIYSSENANIAADAQDPEVQKALAEAGLLNVKDGKYTISERGRDLHRAAKDRDWDSAGRLLSDAGLYEASAQGIDEDFALRLKQGGPTWERRTNAYELALRQTYQAWADDTAAALEGEDDDDKFREKLAAAIALLLARLAELGRRSLPEALGLGLGDVPASPEALGEVAAAVAQNEQYLNESLGPAIEAKTMRRVHEDPLIRGDRAALGGIFSTFLGRIGSYAGAFWALIMRGVVDKLRQGKAGPKVRWVLDRLAKHCPDCLRLAGTYDNYEALMAATGNHVPGSGGTVCGSNCRCHLEVETPRGWARM